tara:strand:- start:1284 stop:1940 length:657 start_codon:yes stop_codon:yes gene_type:complete
MLRSEVMDDNHNTSNRHLSEEELNISSNQQTTDKTPKKWWQWFLLYPAFAIALIGAVPTYIEYWDSSQKDVPFGDSTKADLNRIMWRKNLGCTAQPMDPYITLAFIKVDATICESGDVFVRITTPNNENFFEWVSLEKVSKPQVSHIANFSFIQQAFATEGLSDGIFSNNGPQVLCQRWLNQNLLLRRVYYPGRGCFDETINTYSGQVISSRAAPCNC